MTADDRRDIDGFIFVETVLSDTLITFTSSSFGLILSGFVNTTPFFNSTEFMDDLINLKLSQ